MAKTISKITALIAVLVAALAIPSSALATNGHQDHQGACARSTTSINKGVNDLAYNGVATKFAKFFGIKSINGSIKKQMKDQLIVGKVAKTTRTNNNGCDGHGGVFGADKRTLYKGERVIVKPPPSIGKDACTRPSGKCKSFVIVVHVVLPSSCWNLNTGTIKVRIWIKKDKVPPPPIKPPTVTPPPPGGCVINIGGDNNGIVGCNVIAVCTINGKQITDSTVCSTYQNCVAIQGNTWNSTQNVCTTPPPPTCEQAGNCPPPPVNPAPAPVCYGTKAHLQQNGDDYLFCEVIVPSGATTVTGEMITKLAGSTADSSVSSLEPWARWDDTPNHPSPCPANTKCYRIHMWAGTQTGWLNLRFTVTAIFPTGSNQTGSTDVAVPIKAEAPF